MSLIDDIERLGWAIENGADRRTAIDELRALFEQHPEGGNIDYWSAGELLDDWHLARERYNVIRVIPDGALRQLRAAAHIEARLGPDEPEGACVRCGRQVCTECGECSGPACLECDCDRRHREAEEDADEERGDDE